MNSVNRRSLQIGTIACLLQTWTGCAGSDANSTALAPTETTTTTSAVPTVNGTYDRANDPAASNAGVGTTEMRPQPPLVAAPTAPAADPALTDGQIAGIASRIDLAEIDAGKLALSHARSAKVRQFAQHMVSAHGTVETKLTSMLKTQGILPAESAVCDKLTRDTESQKQTMAGQSGTDFDRTYMTAQLRDHQDVLDLFDSKLVPDAQNPELKTSLLNTRTKVVEHIQMAKDVLASLPSS
jgi:putative membrane protein